jgi:hypothetical protein
MCVICLEYKKHKDLADARRMLEAAKREWSIGLVGHIGFGIEPSYFRDQLAMTPIMGIDEKHLKQIEDVLNYREKLLKRKMK